MPIFPNLPAETIAFWLGFLAATVFWFVASRLRPIIAHGWNRTRERLRMIRQSEQERIHEQINRYVLKRAQAMHLAAPLFALDEILIAPRLLAPPPTLIHPSPSGPDRIIHQILPYLPDWPELAGFLPTPTLTLAEALQNGVPIAVIGQPGAGKTTVLADLASRVARHQTGTGTLSDRIPVLVSIFDVPTGEQPTGVLEKLVTAYTHAFPAVLQRATTKSFPKLAAEGELLLLVDGLDELTHPELEHALAWITALQKQFPKIGCAITTSPHQVGRVTAAGFLPLPVVPWNRARVMEFAIRWSRLWSTEISGGGSDQSKAAQVDPRLLASWLAGTGADPLTPLEWTLKTWSALAGDVSGARNQDGIEDYLRRCTQNRVSPQALGVIAGAFINQKTTTLSLSLLEGTLSRSSLSQTTADMPAEAPRQKPLPKPKTTQGKTSYTKTGQVLSTLLECGLLTQDANQRVRFSHPVMAGYLAAGISGADQQVHLSTHSVWAIETMVFHYLAGRTQTADPVMRLLEREQAPFFGGLLAAARWLKDAPASSAGWRAALLRRLLGLMMDDTLAMSQRARLVAAFLTARDPAVAMAFKQFLTAKKPALRQLAALGLGALESAHHVGDLVNLLADPSPDVRSTACLALAAVDHPLAEEAVLGALYEGDEVLQQTAAEALASKPPRGYDLLKTALSSDLLMARRAAVIGIGLVDEPWAAEILERVAIEDAQWAVRTTATQAMETRGRRVESLPDRLPAASDSPWLIAFAGKQGVGVPADRFPGELLLSALHGGTLEERNSALIYLREVRSETISVELFNLACDQGEIVREAALYALWQRGEGDSAP